MNILQKMIHIKENNCYETGFFKHSAEFEIRE
jgi:hypothetical protein